MPSTTARNSDTITEIQTPLISQISGSSITAAHSKIIVRTKEMIAEVKDFMRMELYYCGLSLEDLQAEQ